MKNFQSFRDQVNSSFPSIFTKDDVIKLIDSMENEIGTNTFDRESFMEKFRSQVYRRLDRMNTSDVVDYNSAEFDLNGNEISVSDICLDVESLVDVIVEEVDDVFDVMTTPEGGEVVTIVR